MGRVARRSKGQGVPADRAGQKGLRRRKGQLAHVRGDRRVGAGGRLESDRVVPQTARAPDARAVRGAPGRA